MEDIKKQFETEGFAVLDHFYTDKSISNLLACIEAADTTAPTFRKTKELFAIRQFLTQITQ